MNLQPKFNLFPSMLVAAAMTFNVTASSAQETFKGFRTFTESFQVKKEEPVKGTGINPLDMNCIRQKGNREFPYPIQGHEVIVNPPVFTWPMADYEYPDEFPPKPLEKPLDEFLRYDIQLGRTPDFSDADAVTKGNLRLPFYNPHKALQPGVWYWRYRTAGKEWSATYHVTIPEGTPAFESPSVEEATRMMPQEHPILFKSKVIEQPTPDQKLLLRVLRKKAAKAYNSNLAAYKVKGKPIPANASESERAQIMRFHLRYEVEGICKAIQDLLTIYQIDGNSEYLTKALAFSDHIAAQDPVQTYRIADFTGSMSMSTLAEIYDVAYDQLTDEQKKTYEHFISEVASRIIAHCLQENIGSADGILYAHFFQHTFCDLFQTSIVMRRHIPEAQTWFEMLYDTWLSRSPGGGFLADGVWPNGNIGYIHVNMESMVKNFLLYRDLFKVNLFQHPWYKNCANALAYTFPIRSAGDGFSDDSERITNTNALRPDFAYILGQELNNPFALNYAYELTGQPKQKLYRFSKTNFIEYRFQHKPHRVKPMDLNTIPQSVVFPQSGMVMMNTNVLDSASNVFVSFRSSPFGVGSHGLAEQNSFNLSYKGKPVFYPTGYKITTADKHYLLAHKHSRARNTITVNGKTQAYSHSAYGWIARYLDGKDITYTLGDASKAYVPFDKSALNWITVLKDANAYTSENGFILNENDNPKVKTFRRHLSLLRPNILVIYDELESEKDVTWTFQLNGLERSNMSIDVVRNSLLANTDNCDVLANVFGSSPIRTSLIDTSYVKPFDWLNPQRGRAPKVFEKNQYHSRFENAQKCKKMRFLAIIQIDESDNLHFVDVKPDKKGNFVIGDYRINACLDTSKEARLEIENTASGEYLLYGPDGKNAKDNSRKFSHSTLLYQKDKGWQESVDRHPLMAPDEATIENKKVFESLGYLPN